MKPRSSYTTYLIRFVLISLFSAVMSSQAAQADEESLDLKYASNIKVMEFSKRLKVRGFKISDGVYWGQAKVGGKYGVGVVVDKKTYAWGVNHRGFSILKRF